MAHTLQDLQAVFTTACILAPRDVVGAPETITIVGSQTHMQTTPPIP